MASCLVQNCGGLGKCLNSTGNTFSNYQVICSCSFPFVNQGDFLPRPNIDCAVNFVASIAFWACCLGISVVFIIGLFAAMRYLKRGSSDKTKKENISLFNLMFANICLLITSCLEVSAKYPGQRSVGVDFVTTLFFILHEISMNFHALLLPFIQTGTSILPYALDSYPISKHAKRRLFVIYSVLILFLMIASQLFILFIVFFPNYAEILISCALSFLFLTTFASGFFCTLLLTKLLRSVNQMELHSKDFSMAHQKAVQATKSRAKSTRRISIFVFVLYAPVFLAFASSPILLLKGGWIWIPFVIRLCDACSSSLACL